MGVSYGGYYFTILVMLYVVNLKLVVVRCPFLFFHRRSVLFFLSFFLSSIFTNQRFTGTFAKENGGGFLTDHFPKATKACWDIEGVYCSSRYVCYFRVYFILFFGFLLHTALPKTSKLNPFFSLFPSLF